MYLEHLSDFPLYNTNISLHSYTGTAVPVLGSIHVPVIYKDNPTCKLDLLVVKGNKPALFGRDWLKHIKIDWENICRPNNVTASVKSENFVSEGHPVEFKELLQQNEQLFSNDNTGIKEFTASLKLKPNARPVYQKSRPVPYSMIAKVEDAYEKLIKADIFYPVANSQWASPVVHVPKTEGPVRVCGDYKTVNELIQGDGYKLPNISKCLQK